MTGLVELARADWPGSAADTVAALPGLPGFIGSGFSPLIAEVAERCLRQEHGSAPAPADRGGRTAVIVASALGDLTSAVTLARAVDTGARVGPLLFFQSVPNAVVGHVAARWGLAGPVACVDSIAAALDVAELLIRTGDADEALVVVTDDGDPPRATATLVHAPHQQPVSKGDTP